MWLCSPESVLTVLSLSTKLTFTPRNGSAANTAISSGKLDWFQHMGTHGTKSQHGELHFVPTAQ